MECWESRFWYVGKVLVVSGGEGGHASQGEEESALRHCRGTLSSPQDDLQTQT